VPGPFRVAGVVEGIRERLGEPDTLIESAVGQQPRVAAAGLVRGEGRRGARPAQDLRPACWYTHRWSPRLQQ